jgi:hypothetical protein
VVAGQLAEPFETETDSVDQVDARALRPGDAYVGSRSYEIVRARITSSGTIKRKLRGGGHEVALADGTSEPNVAAREIVRAWRALRLPSIEIGVNAAGHAWWRDATGARFLGVAPHGFAWPGDDPNGPVR